MVKEMCSLSGRAVDAGSLEDGLSVRDIFRALRHFQDLTNLREARKVSPTPSWKLADAMRTSSGGSSPHAFALSHLASLEIPTHGPYSGERSNTRRMWWILVCDLGVVWTVITIQVSKPITDLRRGT